jgi:hypothetical protein
LRLAEAYGDRDRGITTGPRAAERLVWVAPVCTGQATFAADIANHALRHRPAKPGAGCRGTTDSRLRAC